MWPQNHSERSMLFGACSTILHRRNQEQASARVPTRHAESVRHGSYEGGAVTVTGALNVNSIRVPGATFFLRKKPPFIRNGAELTA
jgi:hypothetical protein